MKYLKHSHWKRVSDSSLLTMTKPELVQYVRILENNYESTSKTVDEQYDLLVRLSSVPEVQTAMNEMHRKKVSYGSDQGKDLLQ